MSPYKLPGSMTARQFAKAAKKANVSPMRLARARRVLVGGETARDVAASEGVGIEAIRESIYKVYTPPGRKERFWSSVSPPRRG